MIMLSASFLVIAGPNFLSLVMAHSTWGWCFLSEPHTETVDAGEVLDIEGMVDREGEVQRSMIAMVAGTEAAVKAALEAAVEDAANALDRMSSTVTVGPCDKV